MMAGEALRGRQWRTPLSRDLNVTDRTIGNRAAGLGCPTGLIERMLPLLRARQKQMHLVIALAERHQNR